MKIKRDIKIKSVSIDGDVAAWLEEQGRKLKNKGLHSSSYFVNCLLADLKKQQEDTLKQADEWTKSKSISTT